MTVLRSGRGPCLVCGTLVTPFVLMEPFIGTIGLSEVKRWAVGVELNKPIGGGEAPVRGDRRRVAPRIAGWGSLRRRRPIRRPAIQTLPGQHSQLDLGDVQLIAMSGHRVEL
jgi:hypothetical protein